MSLAKNIRFLRKKNDWSQEYVAQKLGYKSYTTIQKWEMGTSEPPLKKLKELSELFHADMHDLVNLDFEVSDKNVSQEATKSKINGSIQLSLPEQKMVKKYRFIDDHGKAAVDLMLDREVERCKLINDPNVITFAKRDPLEVVAAHERTDIEVTQEMIDHDNDIMDDDDF